MTSSVPPPIRVGLIGYGFSGQTFHAPLIQAVPDLDLRLVASRDTAKVHADLPEVKVASDPQTVATSDEVDLVVIASPNDSHARLARTALEAGKDVIVDKPFTVDLAEARGLVKLASGLGRTLSVFHNRRWDSDFLTIRRAIADGLVGTVAHFESHIDRFRPQVRDRWRERDGPGSGLWFDLGPHLVDQALLLFGLPSHVQANLARQRTGALTDDWAHVVLEYPRLRVVLHASMLAAGGSNRFVVHGDAGSVIKQAPDRQEQQLIAGIRPGQPEWGTDPDDLIVVDADGGRRALASADGDQREYYSAVVDACRGRGSSLVQPMQALTVMAVIEAALEAAKTRRSTEVALSPEERAAWD